MPGRQLQEGDAGPWHRPEQLSLLSQVGFLGEFGWECWESSCGNLAVSCVAAWQPL